MFVNIKLDILIDIPKRDYILQYCLITILFDYNIVNSVAYQ